MSYSILFIIIGCASYLMITCETAGISQKIVGCNQPLDRGHSNCSKRQKEIKYYFDKSLDLCFPFLYEGCGGGSNHWDDSETCMQRCRPADKGNCGGATKPTGTCSNRDKTCPDGSKCLIMAFGIGMCCDEQIQEQWVKEHRPECEDPNAKLVTETVWFGEQPLLGKSCDHQFCPAGSKCIEGRWIAHCCR